MLNKVCRRDYTMQALQVLEVRVGQGGKRYKTDTNAM